MTIYFVPWIISVWVLLCLGQSCCIFLLLAEWESAVVLSEQRILPLSAFHSLMCLMTIKSYNKAKHKWMTWFAELLTPIALFMIWLDLSWFFVVYNWYFKPTQKKLLEPQPNQFLHKNNTKARQNQYIHSIIYLWRNFFSTPLQLQKRAKPSSGIYIIKTISKKIIALMILL
jgi:hypothetical protein